jgi:flagellar motor component MotA
MYYNKYKASRAEKEKCLPTIAKILKLAMSARKSGILHLEELIAKEKNVFLKTGISMLVDAIEPEIVRDVLESLILADDYTAGQELKRRILMEGIICIQEGYNPRVIELRLRSMLGEEYIDRPSMM